MCYLNNCYLDLIGILTTLITSFIVSFFFSKILTPKKESKYYLWKYFIIIFGTYLICRLHPYLYELRAMFISASYIISMLLLSKDKLWKKLLLFFATYFFVIIVDIITSCTIFSKYGYTFNEVNSMMDKEYYKFFNMLYSDYNTLAMNGLNNVSLTFLFISLMMLMKKETRHLYVWLISLVITVLVISNCILSYLYLSDILSLIVLLVCQIVAIILMIYVIQKLSIHFKYDKSLEENKFLKEKEKMQSSYYELLMNREENVKKINHDIKNSLQIIYSLKDEEKRKELIDKINTNLDRYHLKKYTSNEILNVVFNIKVNEAKKEDLNINIEIKNKLTNIEDLDICNLFTNILDNAIEASTETKAKTISLSIHNKLNYTIITCENSYNGTLKIDKKNNIITKKDRNHGYGLKVIDSIVKKYNGTKEISYNDNTFKLVIILPKTD